MEYIIEKTADAVDTVYEPVMASAYNPVTYQVDGDLASNTITVQGFGGTSAKTLTTAYDSDEVALVLSATKMWITFFNPANVAFTKGATTNAVGVMKLG